MFFHLNQFNKIFVCGPHRAGTTFCTHAIAMDSHKTAIDESVFRFTKLAKFEKLVLETSDCVIQCPSMLPWLPLFTGPDDMVVFMVRSIKDINASFRTSRTPQDRKIPSPPFTAEQAYRLFEKIRNCFYAATTVNYSVLAQHPLFIPKPERKGWHFKQIDASGKHHATVQY